MNREILTHPLTKQQIRTELEHLIEFFSIKSVTTCQVLFGFAWGNEDYSGDAWNEENIPLIDLPQKIEEVEFSGLGALGQDDLFVKVPGMEFHFCHEADIHICFVEQHPDIETFFQRWSTLGFMPSEWLKSEDKGPGQKVRGA